MTDKQMDLAALLPKKAPQVKDVDVPLSALDTVPVEVDAKLVRSLEEHGLLQPIVVQEVKGRGKGHGHYHIVDGRRRVAAAEALEWETIKARVYEITGPFADVLTLAANANRSANPVAELQAIKGLMAAGADEATICRATGLSRQTLRKRLTLDKVPETILAAVGEGRVAVSTAEELAKFPEVTRERLATKLEDSGKLTRDDVEHEREARQQQAAQTLASMEIFAVSAWAEVAADLQHALDKAPEGWAHKEALQAALASAREEAYLRVQT